jgi:adenine-specific DNA-methyltransferase
MPPLLQELPQLRERSDSVRISASRQLTNKHRSELGQFLTPSAVAELMASMVTTSKPHLRLLEPGAGTGSLCLAITGHFAKQLTPPTSLHFVCYEIETAFLPYLEENLRLCAKVGASAGVSVSFELRNQDFLSAAAEMLECSMLGLPPVEQFDLVVMNPPYKKISTSSKARSALRSFGLETVNLYSGFVAAAVALLAEDGEMISITPRSFCNGPYYRNFRKFYLERMAIQRLHVFESRSNAFKEDEVLQETVIAHAIKSAVKDPVTISSSVGADLQNTSECQVPYGQVVAPNDPELFVRLLSTPQEEEVSRRIHTYVHSLGRLGLEVSTGRVVDFRSRQYLSQDPSNDTVPLIYPMHFSGWEISWPLPASKKPNALRQCVETESMLLPPGRYVLTKRFSAKEEARRVSAVVYDAAHVSSLRVGFENHVNYFHSSHCGLEEDLAWGLAAYLNSGLVDTFFGPSTVIRK